MKCYLSLLVAALGCSGGDRAAEQPVAAWRLSAPVADIGVAEGEVMLELSQATSSFRFEDGRILVANSGTQELRVFDSAGRYLSSIGRKGQGPGEFEGSLQVRSGGTGRFTVADDNLQRVTTFDTAGSFVGESRIHVEGNAFPLSTWLHRDNWIDGPVDTAGRAGVARVLDRLSPVTPGSYRFVKVADDGRLWIQVRGPRDSAASWQVLSGEGLLLATIPIPGDLEVHHVGQGFLTARKWAMNDVEHIVVFAIEGDLEAQGITPESPAAAALPAVPGQVARSVAEGVRNLVTVQEMYYADHGAYATRAADLTGWEAPTGTAVHLMAADRRGWVGLLVHQSYPYLCGMAVGGSTPPGWGEGSPKCSR